MDYEQLVRREIAAWRQKMLKRPGMLNRMARRTQEKVNSLIPERAHRIITETIRKVVQAALLGSEYTTSATERSQGITLAERDRLLEETLNRYRKIAAAEGAGTGAGGILLGLADLPLLISIKMKFLFVAASIYGFDVRRREERLFILHVFQLAFSSDRCRADTLHIVEHWHEKKHGIHDIDWRVIQQEYRDYIDLVKMLQLLPGIGAAVGAYANYNLLDHLGETAKNAYRMRLLALEQ
jgi:hypothetical protein